MSRKKQEKGPHIPQNKLDKQPKRFLNPEKNEVIQFIVGLCCIVMAFYLLITFFSFFTTGAADYSIVEKTEAHDLGMNNGIKNHSGVQGSLIAYYLINGCFGISSICIVFFLAACGLKLMRAYNVNLTKWFICCSLIMIWFSITLGFFFETAFSETHIYPGGMHGHHVSLWLESQIGAPGVCLLLLITAIFFAIYLSRETMNWIRRILHPEISLSKWKIQGNPKEEITNNEIDFTPKEDAESIAKEFELSISPTETTTQEDFQTNENDKEELELKVEEETIEEASIIPLKEIEEIGKEIVMEVEEGGTEEDEAYEGPETEPFNPKLDLENYRYPTLGLLKKYENNAPSVSSEELNANKERIIDVLRNFGVEIASIKATVGPTITLYEITPAPGIRIAKIRNLENDIALSLSALGIRIIAPIPGKGTIGIEVPNKNPRIVSMESILASKKYQESDMELPVAVGKTISNEVYMFDLAKAPHLLVAGATGMGKSVGLNAIVTSLLYKKHPAELKFVIIDPKKVEFSIYAPIENHFLAKLPDGDDAIITDVKKVVQTLNSLCVEMDTRYDLLKSAGSRNIKEYNKKFIERRLNPEKGHKYLPYIVVIVDEFGDLIMTAGKEVELPIARIAQLARAVGIHMIIATQRPTTNIITGTIKANFPARMAFRTSSMIDSRTILDRPGANQLIGKGDMLYLQGQDPVRVQCAFVDTPEVENIVAHICTQQSYLSAFMLPEPPVEGGDNGGGGAVDVDVNRLDPMIREAAKLIIIHQQGSTSLIQRKFSIGYNRAGRIMDQLERIGVVGPAQGSKPRDVLCQTEMDLDMLMSEL